MSQAKALWETKSQIAGLACQDTRYKGAIYQAARQNKNNHLSNVTHKFISTRGHPKNRGGANGHGFTSGKEQSPAAWAALTVCFMP